MEVHLRTWYVIFLCLQEMNNLVTENENLRFEVNRLKANKADLKKQMGLLENSESDKFFTADDTVQACKGATSNRSSTFFRPSKI